MRSAIDTNVLVRLLVGDDAEQLDIVRERLPLSGTLVVSNVALCELVWVLRRTYRMPPADIADAINGLLETAPFELDGVAARAGLAMMARGGDFGDGVIQLEAARTNCDQVLTFDQNFARNGGRVPVTLLTA